MANERELGIERLKSRFGERATAARAVREQHGHGESHHGDGVPDLVVFAVSTDEVAEIVRICEAHRLPLVPFGAGTSLEGNVTAVEGGVTVDLSRMTEILRVSPDDLDCTVQAGVTRVQLNSHLRDTGLFFPIDPGAEATIGGMAATRASGTNAVRYGTMRDAVLSLTVVTAGGRIVRTSRRARKSAAGYDLTRLFVGSEGTLGIITEVTLRLHGQPEAVAVAVATFPQVRGAVETTVAVIQAGIPVARFELLDDAQMAAIAAHSKLDLPILDTLFIELHGTPGSIAEQMRTIEEIARDYGATSLRTADSAEERAALWKARHQAFYATVALRPGAKGWATDVCVPISRLTECIDETKKLLLQSTVPATIVGHVGDGNFHVVFSVMADDPAEMAEVKRLNGLIVALALAADGTSTGEHGIGTGKIAYMEAEHGEALALMRAVKTALDPLGIFNPGKILPPAAKPKPPVAIGYRALLARAEAEIETLDAATAHQLATAGAIHLVDLRDPREVQREGRIPGAFHCPRGMLEFWIDPESPYHKPFFAEPHRFVFHCASGWRSALAAKTAQDMGLAPVAHLGGGFTAWKAAGLPVETVEKKA